MLSREYEKWGICNNHLSARFLLILKMNLVHYLYTSFTTLVEIVFLLLFFLLIIFIANSSIIFISAKIYMYKTLSCRLQFLCILNLLDLLLLTFFNGDNIFFSKLVKAQDIKLSYISLLVFI